MHASPGNTQATVGWTAPASNGGSAITSYTVTSSPGGFTATTLGTSASVTGLTNGTPYTFTVTASNAIGTGPASGASAPVTPISGIATSNSAEGGTAGTSVTAANSGGTSGTAFTVFTKGSGAALVFSTAANAHGSLGYALTGTSGTATSVGWNGYSATSMALRFYYNPGPSLPSTVLRLADVRNASGTAARIELSASNQIFIQNNAGATIATFSHALQANTWYRIELAISISSVGRDDQRGVLPARLDHSGRPCVCDDDRQHRCGEHHPGDGRLDSERDLDRDQLLRRHRIAIAVDGLHRTGRYRLDNSGCTDGGKRRCW